ncbi:MAG: diaminopimelate decarboxylase [Caldilineaceae bacterium]|nr:diaminopimelate decarboxylase [Caldilineaceae bacterium]
MLTRLDLFPITARIVGDGASARLQIGGCDLTDLAAQFGTPLYLYDRATLDTAVAAYEGALSAYPGPTGITYAGKAGMNLALAQWAASHALWLDCTGQGEIAVARAAGVDRAQILVHGVNKSPEDLAAAVDAAGVIVVDNLDELQRLIALADDGVALPQLWLRLRPGVAVETHAYRQTGQSDSKFGLSSDEFLAGIRLGQAHDLPLTGLHFHQGSHFHDPAPIGPALDAVLDLLAVVRSETGWTAQHLSPGGGWGVAYHEDDLPQPSVADYVGFISNGLQGGCAKRNLPLPALHVEPGRSLVARAGVALYRVGAVKRTPNRRWLLLDGGMSDNIRPALYGARYSALPVVQPGRSASGSAWLGGPYCESGDVLIQDLPMADVTPGELVAVPASGAYHIAMSSNYNGSLRPAVLWLDQGEAHLIQRRETVADLMRRDLPLP